MPLTDRNVDEVFDQIASGLENETKAFLKTRRITHQSIYSLELKQTRGERLMDQVQPLDSDSTLQQYVTREHLYEEVWSEPAVRVAAKYGVSGSFLARVCERLRIPRPRPGYWSKLAVGKVPPKPPLPPAEPGDETQWRPADTPWVPRPTRPRPDKTPIAAPSPASEIDSSLTPVAIAEQPTQTAPTPRKRVAATHPLIEGVIGLIPQGKTTSEGYCKPRKRLIPDIITSPKQLETIVRLANKLYRALEARGHRVRIANASERFHRQDVDPHPSTKQQRYYAPLWSPERPTVVYINSIAIGLTLFETTEYVEMQYVHGEYVPASKVSNSMKALLGSHTWTHQQLVPSGEFSIQAYSPYQGTTWSKQWRGKPGTLADQLEDIVDFLETQPSTITDLIELARLAAEKQAREWEETKQKYAQEEQAKRRAQATESSRTELLAIIEDWNEAKRIAAFFEEVISNTAEISEETKAHIVGRLAAARKLIGGPSVLARLANWLNPDEIYDQLPKSHWENE